MVAKHARGQLNRENYFPLPQFAAENLASQDRFGRPVPHQPAHAPHTETESECVAITYSGSKIAEYRSIG